MRVECRARDSALNVGLSLGTSAVMGLIVTAVALAVGARALASYSLQGDAI